MSVQALSSYPPIQDILSLTGLGLNTNGTSTAPGSIPGGASDNDSASISGPAALLSKLQQLETQDPALAQKVLSHIAKHLHHKAQGMGGQAGQALDQLASQFDKAAQTGDLSQITLPQGSGTSASSGSVLSAYTNSSQNSINTLLSFLGAGSPGQQTSNSSDPLSILMSTGLSGILP